MKPQISRPIFFIPTISFLCSFLKLIYSTVAAVITAGFGNGLLNRYVQPFTQPYFQFNEVCRGSGEGSVAAKRSSGIENID